jgi:hypothetical protein
MVETSWPLAIKSRPARPKPRPKAEGQGWNPLLDYFSSMRHSSTEGLLEELKNLQEDRDLLWYPSSGIDLTDINKINRVNVRDIPRIFIHTDPLDYPYPENMRENEVLRFQKEWEAVLFKIPINGEYKWLFQIKINNYEFLPRLLKSGVRVPFLYTACDGVTTGGPQPGKFPITTFYLSRFYQVLGIKYHVTEYSREFI